MVADSAAMIRLMPAELIEAIEANNGAALDTRVIIPLRAELLVAGISFAAIAVVVAVRGLADLKSLIRTLAAKRS
jgi:hypothetical protein